MTPPLEAVGGQHAAWHKIDGEAVYEGFTALARGEIYLSAEHMSNMRGVALALVSSIFIGASYIIKKKGLMRAGQTGVRAREVAMPTCCSRSGGSA